MQESEEKKPQNDEEILAVAKQRFELAVEAEHEIRELALADAKFSIGEQWDEKAKLDRHEDGRPCLVINRMPQAIRQVTNDARQNRPAIKISPVDDKADIETAKIRQGLIRHIEYASDADTAYDTALDSSVRRSFGFFRIVAEYCDPLSFYQDLRIRRVRNPFSCYLDPASVQPDGSDAEWGFATEDITKSTFKKLYPKSELAGSNNWESYGNIADDWVEKDTVRIADYYFKEYIEKTLFLLSDGTTLLEDELPNGAMLPAGIAIIDQRQTLVPIVHHLKINGVEILERTIWPGRFIPIVPVIGEEIDIDGKRILEGLIRHAKDPQRMYNYWASSETESIALAPRAPWIGAEGQFEGYENQWASANRRNHAFLEYKPVSIGGQPAPPPQRNTFEPAVQAITQARMLASDDIKATTGIYDAALGNRSNESSGIAIQRRNVQAQTSNFHFVDNLSKSIRHAGRILNDAIPHIYDTARAARILGEDGSEEIVRLNEQFERKGQLVHYRMDVGKYDVTVSTGPSFETKRQEAASSMLELTKAMPQTMQVGADLIVKNLDLPGAQELAERLKKTLPPGMVDDKDKKPIPPEIQAQMQQQMQLIEQLTSQLNEKTQLIETKAIEIESRERIEMAKIQRDIEMKLADLGSTEALALLRAEIDEINARMSMLNYEQPIERPETQQEFEATEADQATSQYEQQPTGGPSPGNSMEQMP